MAVNVQDKLERQLFEVKEHASGLNQQVEAFKKELGAARREAAKVAVADAARAAAEESLAAANSRIKALERALDQASDRAARGDAAIAAAKAVSDGLAALKAL